jgi:hypothetical protein
LERPLGGYEVHKLAFLMIKLSKVLNSVFDLPPVKKTASWSWQTIWDHSFGWWDEWQGQPTVSRRENVVVADRPSSFQTQINLFSWFRFNLRPLASHSAIFIYCIVLFYFYEMLTVLIIPACYAVLSIIYFLCGPSWIDQFGFVGILKVFSFDEDDNGFLKENEREEILAGHRAVDKSRIRYRGDVMDLPYFTYECRPAVDFFIRVSKQLNRKYGLPKEPQTNSWPTMRVIQYALKHRHQENVLWFCCRCFRFNLRFLASIQQVGKCICIAAMIVYFLMWINTVTCACACAVGLFLYYISPVL